MGISDRIAEILEQMLESEGGLLVIRRNDFAAKVGCAPSQINYVIGSRFTPERGYLVESRRGGSGYVRIIRRKICADEYLMHFFCAIGDEINEKAAAAYIDNLDGAGFITRRERKLMLIAVYAAPDDASRADLMRRLVLAVMKENE
ncbi:MAG: CtsR family transcriptional regulator [Clostridiales bacterium]|jgi:transcriptional regulator CtsR|nr:CtsR family transcriptional regulator [Clostridiales bacterium]